MGTLAGMTKEELREGGQQAPQLQVPYIGPARPDDIYHDPDFYDGYDVIAFEFILTGKNEVGDQEDRSGETYRYAEWRNSLNGVEDPVSRRENMAVRVFYILSYLVPDDLLEKAMDYEWEEDNDAFWDELTSRVEKLAEAADYKQKDDLRIKVAGSVYRDSETGELKDNLDFTAYKGFMTDSESDRELEFSRDEKKDNRQYRELASAEADDPSEFEDEEMGDEGDPVF